ncbi:MAG: hypothetical protein M1824_001520 [Vezdaea acicularis]|nr:MAG: hypothetical protein M1824_001520 [Vezdaea acicularis]
MSSSINDFGSAKSRGSAEGRLKARRSRKRDGSRDRARIHRTLDSGGYITREYPQESDAESLDSEPLIAQIREYLGSDAKVEFERKGGTLERDGYIYERRPEHISKYTVTARGELSMTQRRSLEYSSRKFKHGERHDSQQDSIGSVEDAEAHEGNNWLGRSPAITGSPDEIVPVSKASCASTTRPRPVRHPPEADRLPKSHPVPPRLDLEEELSAQGTPPIINERYHGRELYPPPPLFPCPPQQQAPPPQQEPPPEQQQPPQQQQPSPGWQHATHYRYSPSPDWRQPVHYYVSHSPTPASHPDAHYQPPRSPYGQQPAPYRYRHSHTPESYSEASVADSLDDGPWSLMDQHRSSQTISRHGSQQFPPPQPMTDSASSEAMTGGVAELPDHDPWGPEIRGEYTPIAEQRSRIPLDPSAAPWYPPPPPIMESTSSTPMTGGVQVRGIAQPKPVS